MNSETAAAMERVRRVNAGDDVADVYTEQLEAKGFGGLDSVAYSLCDDDRALLARLFIAERDETAIDEAWLRSIGFKEVCLCDAPPFMEISTKEWRVPVFMCGPPAYLDVSVVRNRIGSLYWPPITTRGQLLRLLSALGINITNPAGGA